MVPGSGSWTGCGSAATRTRARTGPWRSTPPWCAPTPPVPATTGRRTSTRSAWRRPCSAPRPTEAAGADDKKSTDPPCAPAPNAAPVTAGRDREGLGGSRGGLTSKIQLAADTGCRVLSRVTSAGQRHDSLGFEPVMTGISIGRRGRGRPRTRPGRLLADKAYSTTAIRAHLRRRGITATLPEPADQVGNRRRRGSRGRRPPAFDRQTYTLRSVVERAITKLKAHRTVATRYDKRDFVYRGSVDVAAIRIWLQDPIP